MDRDKWWLSVLLVAHFYLSPEENFPAFFNRVNADIWSNRKLIIFLFLLLFVVLWDPWILPCSYSLFPLLNYWRAWLKSFCRSQERIQKGIVIETQISRNSRDWLWVTVSAAVVSCTLLSELTVAVKQWIQMLILNTSLSLLVHWGLTFLVKLLELFLVIIKIKLKIKDHLVCCFLLVLFSWWAFPKSSSMGSMWG